MSAKNLNYYGKSFTLKLQSSDIIFDNLKVKIEDEEGISITFDMVQGLSQLMRIFVNLPSTSRSIIIPLQVKSSDTVASVKAKIHEKKGFLPERNFLVFGDKRLDDGCTLADYSIHMDSRLALLTVSSDWYSDDE